MSELTAIKISFEPDHFVEATLIAETEEYRCCCLNSDDGIGELLDAVLRLIRHKNSQSVEKWSFDGYTWWVFNRDDSDVWINCLEFDEDPLDLPSGHWVSHQKFTRVGASVHTSINDLARELVREFSRIQHELGDETYRRIWGYEFPHRQLVSLAQIR